MSTPVLGTPIGPDVRIDSKPLVFDHVPKLRELLGNGGWPGVIYAQVCVHNVKRANDRTSRPAHLRPIRGSAYYSIRGPRGEAAMALMGCGSPIPGAAPESGERFFFTDGEVERLTGHPVSFPIWFRTEEELHAEVPIEKEHPQQPGSPGQDPQGHERVQRRNPPQR